MLKIYLSFILKVLTLISVVQSLDENGFLKCFQLRSKIETECASHLDDQCLKYSYKLEYIDRNLNKINLTHLYGGCIKSFKRDAYKETNKTFKYCLEKEQCYKNTTQTLLEAVHQTCDKLKLELLKKHKIYEFLYFQCDEPKKNQCSKLTHYNNTNFVGQAAQIHIDFKPYLDKVNSIAKSLDINVVVLDAFRNKTPQVVKFEPDLNSMKYAGFAIDFSLDKTYNKQTIDHCDAICLSNLSNAHWAKKFLDLISNLNGKYGVLKYNSNNISSLSVDMSLNKPLFLSIKNSLSECIQKNQDEKCLFEKEC